MRIGFDARWYFSGTPSGRMVIQSLLSKLLSNHPENTYYIFISKRDRKRQFPFQGMRNVRIVYVWGWNGFLFNILGIPFATRKFKIDVAVMQYFSPIIRKFRRVVFIHDIIFKSHPEYFTFFERLYFLLIPLLARQADRICTVSNFEKNRMISFGLSKYTDIEVIHNGVDERFKPFDAFSMEKVKKIRSKYDLPDKYILYVGRITVRKNIANLLEAISIMQESDTQLVIIGKTDSKNVDIGEMIKKREIADRVHMIGYVSDEELPVFFSLARVFCYISLDEAFGLPPLEAMASGVPVVVADHEALKEVCGDAAVYVDPFSPGAISEALDRLIVDSTLHQLLYEKGLQRAKLFTWDKSAKRLLDICKQVCKNGSELK